MCGPSGTGRRAQALGSILQIPGMPISQGWWEGSHWAGTRPRYTCVVTLWAAVLPRHKAVLLTSPCSWDPATFSAPRLSSPATAPCCLPSTPCPEHLAHWACSVPFAKSFHMHDLPGKSTHLLPCLLGDRVNPHYADERRTRTLFGAPMMCQRRHTH